MKAQILIGDVLDRLRDLPSQSVQCAVTSPPYWGLRDYGCEGQLGLERTPEEYIAKMVAVFAEAKRVLRDDGTLWLNIGDSYAGHNLPGWRDGNEIKNGGASNKNGCGFVPGCKPKDLVGIPWMLAFALRADGWYLRQDIIWSKPNPMPESVTDRCTKAHEYMFMLSKSQRYFYDQEAIKEPAAQSSIERLMQNVDDQEGSYRVPGKTNGTMKAVGCGLTGGSYAPPGQSAHSNARDKQRGHSRRHAGFNDRWDSMSKEEQCSGLRNKRSVWEIATQPFSEAHFATFPEALVKPCILAGSKDGDTVLDPFGGSMTTGVVALKYHRAFIGIELNPAYAEMGRNRLNANAPWFDQMAPTQYSSSPQSPNAGRTEPESAPAP